MNTDRKRLGFIGVHRCSSVAKFDLCDLRLKTASPAAGRLSSRPTRSGSPCFRRAPADRSSLWAAASTPRCFIRKRGQPYFFRQNRTCFCMQKGRYLALQYCLRTEKIGSIDRKSVVYGKKGQIAG